MIEGSERRGQTRERECFYPIEWTLGREEVLFSLLSCLSLLL